MHQFDCAPENLSVDQVDEELLHHGYLLLRSEKLVQLAERARAEYIEVIEATELHAGGDRFSYEDQCRETVWRKAAIGSRNGLGESYAQLLLTTYFAPNVQKFHAISELFGIMLKLRNRLMRVPSDFGNDPVRDRFWNASRIHHYPRGGGFMMQHRDTHFPIALGDKPFYQLGFLLSKKQRDFQTGGGFVLERDSNKKIDIETELGFGGLIVFDGKTYHGVDDVDGDRLLHLKSPQGRLAAFVNVYEYRP